MTSDEFVAFLKEHGDHRITLEALHYYSRPHVGISAQVVQGTGKDTKCVGVSATGVLKDRAVHAVTVVHKDHRRQGVGTQLLTAKVAQWSKLYPHLVYTALVAEDNVPSVGLCEKAKLQQRAREERQRRKGPYTAIVFQANLQKEESADDGGTCY